MFWILDVTRTHVLAVAFAAYAWGIICVSRDVAWIGSVACAATFFVPGFVAAQTGLRQLCRVGAIAAAIGICAASLAVGKQTHARLADFDGHHVKVSAVALERARATDIGVSVRVRIERVDDPRTLAAQSLRGRVALLEAPASSSMRAVAGKLVEVRARVDLPAGARNDGERSERDILTDDGVSLLLRAHAPRDVVIGADAPGWSAWWARSRSACAAHIEQQLPPLQATVLEGILWGDRGNLPATLRQEFSDTGTVHVLVTAGLHLGMMAALIAGATRILPLGRSARAAIVIGAAWAYAMLAGLHLPTIRAATMLTAGIIAQETGRMRTASAVLAVAALAVCLPHPLALLSPSFAMSFACVSGIALLGPILASLGLHEANGMPRLFVDCLRTSLAVQLAIWPLQALYFNTLTPYAVLANLLVVPLVGLVMACGSALVLCALLVPTLAASLANLTSWLLTAIIAVVDHIATLPSAHIDVPPPNHVFLILYWLALAATAWAVSSGVLKRRMFAGGLLAAAVLAGAYLAPGIEALFDREVHLDAIDVGQADCILVRSPGMHAMLVDGGGRLERTATGAVIAQPIGDKIAAKTVMPFLLRHWVLHLDAVVLTHPHGDHAGGLPLILARERVGVLYDSAQMYGGPAYRHALEVVRQRHIAWRKAARGESFDLGPTTRVGILAPESPLITGTSSDINNNSVVLRIDVGRVGMLLTGDAQAEAEARLLSHGGADLRADVLKVGHHGSAYSSTPAFLAAVHPKVAIISCGRHNLFGHPSPRTLAALGTAGSRTYRTDVAGGISVSTDGDRISVRSASEP